MKSHPASKSADLRPDPKIVAKVLRQDNNIVPSSTFATESDHDYLPFALRGPQHHRLTDFGRQA